MCQRLAPSLVDALKTLNPKDDKGNRKHKYHQCLSSDVGHPALAQHVHAVTAIMRTCKTWSEFMERLRVAFPKENPDDWLPFDGA